MQVRFCVTLHGKESTLVIVFEVGDDLFEVVFAEGGEYLFLVLFAHDDVTGSAYGYFISFYIEFISRAFSYIFEIITNYPNYHPRIFYLYTPTYPINQLVQQQHI